MILNASFEIPDPNVSDWFIPPIHWERVYASDNKLKDCYAGLHSEFVPSPEHDNEVDWYISAPFHKSRFVVLSTGDLGSRSDTEVTKATITQTVTFTGGQRISGAYFFGTCDYLQYNDFGKIYLQPVDPNNGLPSEIVLAYMDVKGVGDFQSTEGWLPFQYDFTEQTAGDYNLICTVEDVQDKIYKSYLAVDGFKLCTPLYEFGDINMDCSIDLVDLFILSNAWMSECPDPNAVDNDPNTIPTSPWPPDYIPNPNYVPDPNCPCEMADINKNWWVDPDDLNTLTSHWLEHGF